MGVNWVRNGRETPIDLTGFLDDGSFGLEQVQVLSEVGTRFILTPTVETTIENNQIRNIRFRMRSIDEISRDDPDSMILAPFLAFSSMAGWLKERRHFPKDDIVSMPLTPLQKGKPLTLNNRDSSPLVRGFVFERVDHGRFQRGMPNF